MPTKSEAAPIIEVQLFAVPIEVHLFAVPIEVQLFAQNKLLERLPVVNNNCLHSTLVIHRLILPVCTIMASPLKMYVNTVLDNLSIIIMKKPLLWVLFMSMFCCLAKSKKTR